MRRSITLQERAINNIKVYIEEKEKGVFDIELDKFIKTKIKKYYLKGDSYIYPLVSSIFSLRNPSRVMVEGAIIGESFSWEKAFYCDWYQKKYITILDSKGNIICVEINNPYVKENQEFQRIAERLVKKKFVSSRGCCLYHPKLVGTTHKQRVEQRLYKKYIKLNRKK